jgi:hypothetical protein
VRPLVECSCARDQQVLRDRDHMLATAGRASSSESQTAQSTANCLRVRSGSSWNGGICTGPRSPTTGSCLKTGKSRRASNLWSR